MNEQLRAQMRMLRRNYPPERQREDAQRVFARVQTLEAYQSAQTVMAYMAARGELSVQATIDDVLASGRRLALPRCEGTGVMTARWVKSMDDLAPGAYGLLEPKERCGEIPPQEIDLALVPGVAFDRAGRRVGQGGGYYDRFLPRTRALRMGICHDFALLERIETQAHDQRMDALATPSELILIGHNG